MDLSYEALYKFYTTTFSYFFNPVISSRSHVYIQAFTPRTETQRSKPVCVKQEINFSGKEIARFVSEYNENYQIFFTPTKTEFLEYGSTNVLCFDVDAKDRFSGNYSVSEYYKWAWLTVNTLEYDYRLPPNLVIHSGSGLHIYYYLKYPISFEEASGLYNAFPIADKCENARFHPNSYWRGLPFTYNHSYDPPRYRSMFVKMAKWNYDFYEIVKKVEKNSKNSKPYISMSIRDKATVVCNCDVATNIKDWEKVIESFCEKNYLLNKVFNSAYFLSLNKQRLNEQFKNRGDKKGPQQDRSWCENLLLYAMVEAKVPEEYYISILTNWRYGRGRGPDHHKWRIAWVKRAIPKAKIYAFLKLSQSYCSVKKIARNTGNAEEYVESVCMTDFEKRLKAKYIRKNKRRQLCFKFIKTKINKETSKMN